MSNERIYFVSDFALDGIKSGDLISSYFQREKQGNFKNEIRIILPRKKVKKYLVLYKTPSGYFEVSGGRYESLEVFNHANSVSKYTAIQLIQESMIEVEEAGK